MTFCVPNNDEVYCFVEQLLVTRDIKPSSKLNKKCDIARCQGVLRITNSMSLTQKKANTNCENYIHCKQKLFVHLFNRNAFCEGVDTCIFDINQSDRE